MKLTQELIENDITRYAKEIDETYERQLSLERYSRDYNLRFFNIPESTSEGVLQSCVISWRTIFNSIQTSRTPIESAIILALPDRFWQSFCTIESGLELSKRRGNYVMVSVFLTT